MLSWFLNTKIGQYVAAGGAIAAGVSLVLLKAFNSGKDSERAKQQKADIQTYKTRDKVDGQINSKTDAEVDAYLSRHTSGSGVQPNKRK